MRKLDIQELIQLLGMVGIIGSLIFVGLEMRQSQRIALAAQQTERTNMFLNNVNSLAEPKLNYSTMQEQLAGQTPRHYGLRMGYDQLSSRLLVDR